MSDSIGNDIEIVVKSLKANHFSPVQFVENADTAIEAVVDIIPPDATIRFAGSMSIRQMGLVEQLTRRGIKDIDSTVPREFTIDERRHLLPDILLCSSNAVTLDGKLVNTDGIGNRVASMIFGPKKVILVIGKNKIVRDIDEAFDRIKNVIAPYHAVNLGRKPPCVTRGRCTDCKSPERICNVTTVIEKKPTFTDIAIVLVGEDLGLGWDPAWPEERKERIASVYRKEIRKLMAMFRVQQP